MKIKALVEIDLDAEDYRARLRDDVAKPSDAEIATLVITLLSQARLGPLDAKLTATAVTEALATLQECVQGKADYVDENTDERGEYDCDADEGLTDWDIDIADRATRFIAALEKTA